MYPNSLQQLIESFKYLPGVGEKTAERFAFAIMDMDDEQVEFFSSCLSNIKNKIHKCPICNGITDPEDIELEKLIDRVKNESFKEIILAFKPSIEGETTSLYIKRILGDMNISITKIASGIPIGADMEYIDAMTLERALVDRKNVE